jgi:hypothetical protein
MSSTNSYMVRSFVMSKLDVDNLDHCLILHGTFDAREKAIDCAKGIVDKWCVENLERFTSWNQMFGDFAMNAAIPKISGVKSSVFSPVNYAKWKIEDYFK